MSFTFLLDYLLPQKNEKHAYVRTSFYLVSADISSPCLIMICYKFDKMKRVNFGYTYELRTCIIMLLYQTIFHKCVAYFWQLRGLLAYDAVRQARTPPRLSDLAD